MRFHLSLIILAAVANAQNICWPDYTWDFWPGCQADVNADGVVDSDDLAFVQNELGLFSWASDLDGDGVVTDVDVAIVENELGLNCTWPPSRHAILRFEVDNDGAEIFLDLPQDIPGGTYGVAGLQAWVVTEPQYSGWIEPDFDNVWLDLCGDLGGAVFDTGRIGFAFGAAPGASWSGSVHLGRLHGRIGRYLMLYRPAGPPARCAEIYYNGPNDSGVRALRFLVVVNRDNAPTRPTPSGVSRTSIIISR